MRKEFADQVSILGKYANNVFLTGDLGFMALEEVQEVYGDRFINCGISEQNMIGVSAGLAKSGFTVFVYSIAPFVYARPFEQIRNDIVFNDLPVCIVGNGGGYAYGYMGPTHHALEDCASMNALGLNVIVPAFDSDLSAIVCNITSPTYLRLGYETIPKNKNPPIYNSWRELESGKQGVVVALGPMAGLVWNAVLKIPPEIRPSIWAVCSFELNEVPDVFLKKVKNKKLYIFEEHVISGGLGMLISYVLSSKNVTVESITHKYAIGYPKYSFGSQKYHQKESGLDEKSILKTLLKNK
jgi:transketolase